MGRGGTYAIMRPDGTAEVATGFSLYPDPLIDVVADESETRRLFLPAGTLPAKAAMMRAEGWITVAALDPRDSADRLGCTHILANGKATPL